MMYTMLLRFEADICCLLLTWYNSVESEVEDLDNLGFIEVKIMWIIFGAIAIISAALNIAWAAKGKDPKWFRFISLAATALTLCAFYSINAKWVIREDWIALMDVVPTMTRNLWVLTVLSVVINSVTLFWKTDR